MVAAPARPSSEGGLASPEPPRRRPGSSPTAETPKGMRLHGSFTNRSIHLRSPTHTAEIPNRERLPPAHPGPLKARPPKAPHCDALNAAPFRQIPLAK